MAKAGTFKKGDEWTGNAKGRPPKGYSITEWFKNMLNSRPEVKDAIGNSIMKKALQGDVTAQKLVWQYMDGMPKQGVEYSGEIKISSADKVIAEIDSKAKSEAR